MLSQHFQPPSPWHPEGDGSVPSPLGLPCHQVVYVPMLADPHDGGRTVSLYQARASSCLTGAATAPGCIGPEEGTAVPQGISKAPCFPSPTLLCPIPLLQMCFHSPFTRAGTGLSACPSVSQAMPLALSQQCSSPPVPSTALIFASTGCTPLGHILT